MSDIKVKRKAGERWTVIAINKSTGKANQFQIGGWEDMSWPYRSQAEKIVKDYTDPNDDYTLAVVPGWNNYGAAQAYNNQKYRSQVCGVHALFENAKEWYVRSSPVWFCNISAHKELMISKDKKVYEMVPNTYQWKFVRQLTS